MEEEKYTHIIISSIDNRYLGKTKAPTVTKAGTGMQWIDWNKPLPDDIDSVQYKHINGELKAV